jgi:hypothetical protein
VNDMPRNNHDRPISDTAPAVSITPLQPALASIENARRYLGDPSRAKFYADILPELDIVKFGTRTFVTVASLDRLITVHRQPAKRPSQAADELSRETEAA